MDVLALDPTQAGDPSIAAAPTTAVGGAPANPDAAPKRHALNDETLHRALSQLVGGGSNVAVSFRVIDHPSEVVTVFSNTETGQVITEFPREAMVMIAQFFNKLAGAVVDRTA